MVAAMLAAPQIGDDALGEVAQDPFVARFGEDRREVREAEGSVALDEPDVGRFVPQRVAGRPGRAPDRRGIAARRDARRLEPGDALADPLGDARRGRARDLGEGGTGPRSARPGRSSAADARR
jgi:hypothetical protein